MAALEQIFLPLSSIINDAISTEHKIGLNMIMNPSYEVTRVLRIEEES